MLYKMILLASSFGFQQDLHYLKYNKMISNKLKLNFVHLKTFYCFKIVGTEVIQVEGV